MNSKDESPNKIKNKRNFRYLKRIHIYSHLDADGLSSAAIVAFALQREDVGYQITILKQLEPKYIQRAKKNIEEHNEFIIFSDFGSGQIDIIDENLEPESYLILDHHKPLLIKDFEEYKPPINHINPYFYNIDGSFEISAAGVCYFFAKSINQNNTDLSSMAIIGALGDLQNKGKKGAFLGANKAILDDALNTGEVKTETNIAISRKIPIAKALAYTLNERIPGISGNEIQAQNFLEGNNIRTLTELNEHRTLLDLSQREKKNLNTALVQYAVVEKGMDAGIMENLITTFYILPHLDFNDDFSDAKEIAQLLNACGRNGKPSVGIALLMGDKKAYKRSQTLQKRYQEMLRRTKSWAKEHINERKFVRVLDGQDKIDDKKIGTIASILINSDEYKNKPIIGYAKTEDQAYKISGRASQPLVEKGIDLGKIMNLVSKELSSEFSGGGHPPAAGAKIKTEKISDFLKIVENQVEAQLKKKNESLKRNN